MAVRGHRDEDDSASGLERDYWDEEEVQELPGEQTPNLPGSNQSTATEGGTPPDGAQAHPLRQPFAEQKMLRETLLNPPSPMASPVRGYQSSNLTSAGEFGNQGTGSFASSNSVSGARAPWQFRRQKYNESHGASKPVTAPEKRRARSPLESMRGHGDVGQGGSSAVLPLVSSTALALPAQNIWITALVQQSACARFFGTSTSIFLR